MGIIDDMIKQNNSAIQKVFDQLPKKERKEPLKDTRDVYDTVNAEKKITRKQIEISR